MISSQLGTDARPRVFFTGLREGGSWGCSSSAGVVGGRGVGVRDGGGGARVVGVRLVQVGLERRLGAEGGVLLGAGSAVASWSACLADELEGVLAERQLLGRYGGQAAPAGRRQVVAGGLGAVGLGDRVGHLAEQPVGVVVVRDDVVAGGVEGEVGRADPVAGRVRAGQGPAAVLAPPGVPGDGVGVHVATTQVAADGLAEGPRTGATAVGGTATEGGALGALRHVGALGQHRRGVRHHLVDGRARDLGDRLGGLPGADPRLDVARAKR